jgi:hypothetical protein
MHRRQKKPYVIIFVIALALITFGAFRDMTKLAEPKEDATYPLSYYYVDNDADFQGLPRDTSPLMLHVGRLVPKDSTYVIEHTDIEATTLPQREVSLVMDIADMPERAGLFGEAIQSEITRWKRKNNKIAEIVLEWKTDHPDIDRLDYVTTGLHDYLRLDYWIGVVLQRAWIENNPESLAWLQSFRTGLRSYIFDIKEAAREGETLGDTIAALNAYGFPFLIRTEDMPQQKFGRALREANKNFYGFVPIRD